MKTKLSVIAPVLALGLGSPIVGNAYAAALAWYDATDIYGGGSPNPADGADLTTWVNKGSYGSAGNLSPGLNGAPSYSASGINSMGSVRFARSGAVATGQEYMFRAFPSGTPFGLAGNPLITVFAVSSSTAGDRAEYLWNMGSNTGVAGKTVGGSIDLSFRYSNGYGANYGFNSEGETALLAWRTGPAPTPIYNGATFWKNGTPAEVTEYGLYSDTRSLAFQSINNQFLLGIQRGPTAFDNGFLGDVAEWIIFDSALGASDVNDVNAYLAGKWGSSGTYTGNAANGLLLVSGGARGEIAVEQPAGTDLADGAAIIDYGTVASTSAGISKTFVILNTATDPLDILVLGNVSVTGAQATDFTVDTTGMETSLNAGGSTTFSATFVPRDSGTRTATLQIASNDPNKGTFDITLSGRGATVRQTFDEAAAAAGLTGPAAEPLAIPYHDGVENLKKFGFNMNLNESDHRTMIPGTGTGGLPSISTPDGAPVGTLRIEFVRRMGSGLIYTPQKSTDLSAGSWVRVRSEPTVSSINELWERVVYEVPPAADPETRCFARVKVEEREAMDILFIAIDDMNDWTTLFDDNNPIQTPNLDRLAARGAFFTKAYCVVPGCNPSRAAILTGMRPETTGIYNNSQSFADLLPDAVTLPEYFRVHGYAAKGAGKIFHHAPPGIGDDPRGTNRSWDDFQQVNITAGVHQGYTGNHNGYTSGPLSTTAYDWGVHDIAPTLQTDELTLDYAEDVMDEVRTKPMFLAVGIFRPHLPFWAPPETFARYPLDEVELPPRPADDLDDVPAIGVQMSRTEGFIFDSTWPDPQGRPGSLTSYVQSYAASADYADEMVGRVIAKLDATGRADKTIIILWSDHGYHLGDKNACVKFTLWEKANHVPLIIVAPGVTTPGSVIDRPVSYLDIFPTLTDLAGLPPKDGVEGESLVPLIEDPHAEWDRLPVMTQNPGNHAVRSARWRYIQYSDGTEELYDHDNDPWEIINLASDPQYASVIADLKPALPEP